MSAFHRLLSLFALALHLTAAAAAEPLVLGIHPYLPAGELHERFRPLAGYLEQRLARRVVIDVASSYRAHLDRIAGGEVDLAFLGPASYVQLAQRAGTRHLLARLEVDGSPTFHGYVVTAENAPIRRLADLAGRRFAFGDTGSTMSHMVPHAMLLEAGIGKRDLGAYAHLDNHEDVALGILTGAFDAGAVKAEVYEKFQPRGLRALARSPAISEHLFIAAGHVDEATVAQLRDALLALREPAVLAAIKETVTALVPVTDADYEPLRRLMAMLPRDPETDDDAP